MVYKNFLTDINKAVDELGVLFNINIHQTRLKLLENWLSERISINFDATMTSTNNLGFGEGDTNSINLKRYLVAVNVRV